MIGEPTPRAGAQDHAARLVAAARAGAFDLQIGDARSAGGRLPEQPPDAVVMDACAFRRGLLETRVEALKSRYANVPVLVLLRDASPEQIASAAYAGADACIDVAGTSAASLCRMLEHVIRGARAEGALAEAEARCESLSRQLSYAATHDALTKLVNRRVLERRVARTIEEAAETDAVHALCYVDLDQFKIVNDTLGHEAGDELLRQLSAFLAPRVSRTDTLARLGGDEFALLLRERTLAQAAAVAEDILQAIRDFQFQRDGRSYEVRASIGVVPIDRNTLSLSDVLGAADTACYAAKEKGRNRVHVKEPDDKTVKRRISEMHLVVEAKHALSENRMKLYQQPILPVGAKADGNLRFEVLIRMLDWDGDIVSPGVFLPAIERYNLSRKVDRWVFNRFLEWTRSRPDLAAKLVHASINVSGLSIGDTSFLASMCAMLDEHAPSAEMLCFEITETAAVQNLSAAQKFIDTLKARGCRFALDDFGSGLSSFGYLKNLPVDFLKIDGMFISGMRTSKSDRVIVKALNDVAHSMGLMTIAEFVEDAETLRIATDLGVDFAQGYGVGHPSPLDELEADAGANRVRAGAG